MIALILAICSAGTYGVADFLGGFAARNANVFRVVAISAPASLVVELALWPVLGATWSPAALGWGAASGVASAAAFVLLYLALSIGPMGVLSPVTAVVSALLPAGIGLLSGERLSPLALLGIPVSIVAILLVSITPVGAGARVQPYALVIAVGAGTAIALQLIALDAAPHDSGVAPLIIGRAVSSTLVIGAVLLQPRNPNAGRANIPLAALAGALDSIANLLFLLAARAGMLTVSAVVVALYPAATVLLARVILAERLGPRQWVGLFIAAVGVALLALA